MEFVGSNDKLGGEKIRLAGDRVAKPTQEKTALFLVVIDIGFNRNNIKTKLCFCCSWNQ